MKEGVGRERLKMLRIDDKRFSGLLNNLVKASFLVKEGEIYKPADVMIGNTDKWNVLVVCEDECPFESKRGDTVWEKRFLFFGGTITTAMGITKRRYYYVVKNIPLEEKLMKVQKKGFITDVEFDVGKKSHPFILTGSEKNYKESLGDLGGLTLV